jgi:hypothetical protein
MTERTPVAGRLVVVFDPFHPDSAALRWALRLASAATVHALFVEESDALALGAFPWAREVALATAEARPLQAGTIEQGLQGRARTARALFDAALAGLAPGATFERVRGRLEAELRRASADATAVLLDWPASGRTSGPWAASVVRTLLDLPMSLVGLVQPQGAEVTSVALVAVGTEAVSARGLTQRLAAPAGARITRLPSSSSAEAILRSARAERADTLLVLRDAASASESLLAELALRWPGSLLVVR